MFTPRIKKETAYLQRMFIPVFRYVKVIKIHQDFPELRLQIYCHVFYGSQCTTAATTSTATATTTIFLLLVRALLIQTWCVSENGNFFSF